MSDNSVTDSVSDDSATRLDPQAPKLILQGTRGPLRGRVFRFQQILTTLGRDGDCDVVIPGKVASRKHASILFRQGRFVVTDQQTLNGTRVNGVLVSRPMILTEGDLLTVGRTEFRVRLSEPESVFVPPPRFRVPWMAVVAAIPFLLGFVLLLAFVARAPKHRIAAAPPAPRIASTVADPRTAPARLDATGLTSIRADANGEVVRVVPVGATVEARQTVIELQAPAAEIAEKVAHLRELNQKYGRRPDHAGAIDQARREVDRARATRTLRSPVTGVMIGANVRPGDAVRRGAEVAHVATRLELSVDAAAINGPGSTCTINDASGRRFEGTLAPQAAEPGRRVIDLTAVPDTVTLGVLGDVRVECGAP